MTAATPLPLPARSSPSAHALAGLALLAAALLLIATDWLRREAVIARCESAGLVFDRAAGQCEEEAIAVAVLALAFAERSERPLHPGPLPPLLLRHGSR
jgi:hypothetical protein